MRALCPLLMLLLVALPLAAPALGAETVGAKFRKANPEYIRNLIPDNPGDVKLSLATGENYRVGFFGTSNLLLRTSRLKTATDVHFRTEPGSRLWFGIQFFQGSGFTWGLPRRYRIDAGNRYTGQRDGENYGRIRVAAGLGDKVRYEVADGVVQIDRFSAEGSRSGKFRVWRVQGFYQGTLAKGGPPQGAEKFPATLKLTAEFSCVVIEDRDPIPGGSGQVEMVLEKFHTPQVSLRAQVRVNNNLRGRAL
ncbi:MAG TPA: hypothetical protein VEI97_12095, partial [bacterium]|nr:hypothetical protein [bacterium]